MGLMIFGILLSGCKNDDGLVSGKDGQGSILGVITDYATGEPVANANVQLRPGGETTLTGSDGRYEFLNVKDGNYSISVSKAEYSELIDDYIIEVKNGKSIRRDVQIKKLPTSIKVIDNNGNNVSRLDFGSDTSTVLKSFNIFNNGTVAIQCKMVYSCNWISNVSSIPSKISPGETVAVAVSINRSLLAGGQNSTILTISTNNGSAEITIMAESVLGNPPIVQISNVDDYDITVNSAKVEGVIKDSNGGTVKECGFCYSIYSNPSLSDDVIRLSAASNSFSCVLSNLSASTTYHCCAYAITNLGTGYSSEITFTTASGLPKCGETTISKIGTTTAKAESFVYPTDKNEISERGFCWSPMREPTIHDYSVRSGFGEGSFSEYLSSLDANTRYWVRSYAKSEYGVAYGPEEQFTTSSGLTSVSTSQPYIVEDEIITGGTIKNDDSDEYVYDRGVCYGFSKNPDLSGAFNRTYDGDGIGNFTSYIPLYLLNKTGYLYIRAFATTKYGTTYGNEVSIKIQ